MKRRLALSRPRTGLSIHLLRDCRLSATWTDYLYCPMIATVTAPGYSEGPLITSGDYPTLPKPSNMTYECETWKATSSIESRQMTTLHNDRGGEVPSGYGLER